MPRLRIVRRHSLLLARVLAAAPCTATHGQENLKINKARLSDRVLVTWAWDHFQGTNMAVIDTGLSPSS